MGILLSRFRKKKTTIEVLEDLDLKIKEIEEYGQSTEQRHKKIVGTLIVVSVVIYIIVALLFYFHSFPVSLYHQLLYISPFIVFPFLIFFLKKFVSWYYKRKISNNRDKLSTLYNEKKKILEDVTEKETYKKAKEILMKFAPEQLKMTPLSPQTNKNLFKSPQPVSESLRRPSTPQAPIPPLPGASELRKRALTSSNFGLNAPPDGRSGILSTPLNTAATPHQAAHSLLTSPTPRTPLPRPILPQQRSYLDRLVEYIVGDGPSNRYALICRKCESHNGMALKEEFEYFGFRCCYCNFWNPARKQKPSAPKLDLDLSGVRSPASTVSSASGAKITEIEGSTSPSESDSDIEVVEKPDSESPDTESIVVASKESEKETTSEAKEELSKSSEETKDASEDKDKSSESPVEDMEVDESPMQ